MHEDIDVEIKVSQSHGPLFMGRKGKINPDYPKVVVEETPSDSKGPPPQYEPPNAIPQQAGATGYNRYDTMTSFGEVGGNNSSEGHAGTKSQFQTIKVDDAPMAPSTFVIASTTVGGALDEPFHVQCPFCRANVTTKIVPVSGCLTYLSCAVVGVLTGSLCCCLPFCCRRCKDIKHYCPECNSLIAIYKRI